MAGNADFPSPTGPKPPNISDSAWRSYTTVDSSKPLSWWADQDKYLDPTATGYERYRSDKINPETGQPFTELVEHPDSLPKGWVAFGKNGAIKDTDPRATGLGNNSGGTSNTTPQPPPPLAWDSSGNYNSAGSGGESTSPLQNALQGMFEKRQGMFGFGNGRTPGAGLFSGAMNVDQNGNPLPQGPNLNGKSLSGGGLLWSNGGDLSDWGGTTPQPPVANTGGGNGNSSPLVNAVSGMKAATNPNVPPPYASGWTSGNTFTPNPASGLNGLGFNNGLPQYNFNGQPLGSPLANALTQQKKPATGPGNKYATGSPVDPAALNRNVATGVF